MSLKTFVLLSLMQVTSLKKEKKLETVLFWSWATTKLHHRNPLHIPQAKVDDTLLHIQNSLIKSYGPSRFTDLNYPVSGVD